MKNKKYINFKNGIQNKTFSKKNYKTFEKVEKIIASIAIILGIAILPSCLRTPDFSSNPLLKEAERIEAEGDGTPSVVKVLSISPADDTTRVSQNPAIILTFNQAMDPASVKGITTGTACTQSVQLSKDNFTTCIPFAGAPTTNDNKKFIFSATLEFSTTYKIKVTTAAKSASGVALQQESLMPNGFETAPTPTVPTVSNVDPAPNGANISRSSGIEVQFSEKMDSSTITGNDTSTTCQGSVQLSKDNFTTCVLISAAGVTTNEQNYTFTPVSGLDFSSTYKIKVTTAAKSKAGIAMAADYIMPNGFTTLSAPIPKVTYVIGSNPDGFYRNGSTINITVNFDHNVNVTGIPELELKTNGQATNMPNSKATYASGSGSKNLVFHYTIKTGDRSVKLDYAAATSLTLGTGVTIKDSSNTQNANLTLPAPGAMGSLSNNNKYKIYFGLPDTRQDYCVYKSNNTWKSEQSTPCTSGKFLRGNQNYPNGQDAHYGEIPLPLNQVPVAASHGVRELTTGLLFDSALAASGNDKDYSDAAAACTGSSKRLPTIHELMLILDYSKSKLLNTGRFSSNIEGKKLWSITKDATSKAYILNTEKGLLEARPTTEEHHVLCIQNTANYYPKPKLISKVIRGQKTVLDLNTKLEWTKCTMKKANDLPLDNGNGGCTQPSLTTPNNGIEWHDAITTCEQLTYAGKYDWRLPNVRELFSIVAPSNPSGPLIDHSWFEPLPRSRYWTSTTDNANKGFSFTVRFATHSRPNDPAMVIKIEYKNSRALVRCVRTAD